MPRLLTPASQVIGRLPALDWLTEMARRKGGLLATLAEALVLLWPDATRLIPV